MKKLSTNSSFLVKNNANPSKIWYNLIGIKIFVLNKKYGGVCMNNYTTNSYEMKREIVNFSKKIVTIHSPKN